MKKIVWSIVGMIVLSAQVLMATITVDVLSSFGEVLTTAYQTNTIQYFRYGNGGSSDTSSYYSPQTSGNVNEMIRTAIGGFNYWQGNFSPSGDFANEKGGQLYFSARIIGTGGDKVSLSKISYNLTPSAYLTAQSGDYSSSSYFASRIGVDYNGSSNPADWILNTSGSGTNTYNEVWMIDNRNFYFDVVNSGSPQDMINAVTTNKTAFTITGDYYYNGTLLGNQVVSIIPEPAVVGMVAIGGVLIWIKRRVDARFR